VVGAQVADATNTLQAAGFKVQTTTQQNDTAPEGQVVDQTPKGGVKADKGSVVTLVVSSGVGKVAVPNVVGKTQAQATSLLNTAGFKIQVVPQADDTIKSGEVISQNPPADAQADKGATVTIVVSSGVAQVPVPSVAGGDLASASATLGAAGFKVTSTQQSSSTVPAGTVITTNPSAGTIVAKGATVQVIVSSGPPATTTTTAAATTTTKATTPPTTP